MIRSDSLDKRLAQFIAVPTLVRSRRPWKYIWRKGDRFNDQKRPFEITNDRSHSAPIRPLLRLSLPPQEMTWPLIPQLVTEAWKKQYEWQGAKGAE